MSSDKCICEVCHWEGVNEEVLSAPNPFDAQDVVYGCPKCNSVDSMLPACEHEGCWRRVTCGTPTPDGYAQTCEKHVPKKAGEK